MDHSNKTLPENTIPTKRLSMNVKVLALAFASLFFLTIDWLLIQAALTGDHNLTFWIWPALASALAISFVTLFSLVNYNRLYVAGLTILTFAGYIYVFPKHYLVLLGGLGFAVLMVWFEQRIRSEEKSRQHFSIRSVSAGSTSVMIYAFLILLGLNIYYNTSADFKANPDAFYEVLGRSVAKSAGYLSAEVPTFSFLGEDQRQILVEATAQFATDRVRQSAEGFQPLFPLIFTLVIIALLKTFAFIFRWLAILFTWIIFKVLLAMKFFRLQKVPVEVETLEI